MFCFRFVVLGLLVFVVSAVHSPQLGIGSTPEGSPAFGLKVHVWTTFESSVQIGASIAAPETRIPSDAGELGPMPGSIDDSLPAEILRC